MDTGPGEKTILCAHAGGEASKTRYFAHFKRFDKKTEKYFQERLINRHSSITFDSSKTHRDMKTVEEIRLSNSDKKGLEYVELTKELAKKAKEMASSSDSFFAKKMAEECELSSIKCENSDCEYAAYTSAHAAEVWFQKVAERV